MPIAPALSVATPSTLALVLANKYVDGTPLYRVADALGRADVSISRGTLGNWVIRASELHLHPVYDVRQQKLRSAPSARSKHSRVAQFQVPRDMSRSDESATSVGIVMKYCSIMNGYLFWRS
jgi:hypothetical protein